MYRNIQFPPGIYIGLARAYSSLANYTIWPGIRFVNERLKFDSTWNPEDISSGKLDSFLHYSNASITSYKKLLQKDPTLL